MNDELKKFQSKGRLMGKKSPVQEIQEELNKKDKWDVVYVDHPTLIKGDTHLEIEKAKVDFNPIYRISRITFTAAACEIFQVDESRLEVRRCIMSGEGFGKLTVYIYREDDESKQYYHLDNGAIRYRNLSPNIHEFKSQLIALREETN